MKIQYIFFGLCIGVIIIFQLIILGVLTIPEENQYAYAEINNDNVNITGVYFPGESYCVYLDGRNREAIQTTEYHEACHFLVQENYEHFCGEK